MNAIGRPAGRDGFPPVGDLVIDDLQVSAAGTRLVRGVSLRAHAGRPLSLIGETGSGKTLVIEAVMGTLDPGLAASGRIMLGGRASPAGKPAARRAQWGRGVAMLPQEPWLSLDPLRRGSVHVDEVYRFVRGADRDTAAEAARRDLRGLGLADGGTRFPFQISGGMAQRVAIAATRATAAPVLLADEPTKGLDATLRDTVAGLLSDHTAAGGVLLTITHDIGLVRILGGDLAVMLDGEVVEAGPVEAVLAAPAHAYTRRLLAAEPGHWPIRPSAPAGAPVVRAEQVGVTLGGRAVLSGLSLEIGSGEWVSVAGPSGVGKTTLGDVLLGLRAPDRGRMSHAPHLPRHAFQKIYQDPVASFAPGRTLRTALTEAARLHRRPDSEWEALLEQLRLPIGVLDRGPDEVSGGELQRLALARALLVRPALLFADEPTSRLDPISQQQTITLIRDTCRSFGCAVLLVTHDPALAASAADRSISLMPPER